MSIELVMLSNHLILCCPILLLPSIFPSIRVFSSEVTLHISQFSHSVMSDTLRPHGLYMSMAFSRPAYWSRQPFPSPGDLPNPGIKPRSPALQADSLPAKPPGKPKKTGVGSLTLLQLIFLTQELNWGLLHCKWILYQLSYEGNPRTII